MKVLNIRNTESFFETLSECTGKVEIIGKNGTGVLITPGSEKMQLLRDTYNGGVISDIELRLSDTGDILKMFNFMVNMDHPYQVRSRDFYCGS